MRLSLVKYEMIKIVNDSSIIDRSVHVSNLHKLSFNRIYIFRR